MINYKDALELATDFAIKANKTLINSRTVKSFESWQSPAPAVGIPQTFYNRWNGYQWSGDFGSNTPGNNNTKTRLFIGYITATINPVSIGGSGSFIEVGKVTFNFDGSISPQTISAPLITVYSLPNLNNYVYQSQNIELFTDMYVLLNNLVSGQTDADMRIAFQGYQFVIG